MNTNTLMDWDCADEVQFALVALLEDNTTDHVTDYRIEKSDPFFPRIGTVGSPVWRQL